MIGYRNCLKGISSPSPNLPNISVSQLNTASAFVVWCVQYWCRSTGKNINPNLGIKKAFDKANINSCCTDVSSEFDNIMKYVSVSSQYSFNSLYGTYHSIGNIEKVFLIVLSLEQNDKGNLSSRVLNTYLPLSCSRIIGSKFTSLSIALAKVKLNINLEPELIDTMAMFLSGNNPNIINNRSLN